MTTPNIDEPKTISEVLDKVYHCTHAREDDFSTKEALKEVERIMEDVIGETEIAWKRPKAKTRNELRKDQRQRLKERL